MITARPSDRSEESRVLGRSFAVALDDEAKRELNLQIAVRNPALVIQNVVKNPLESVILNPYFFLFLGDIVP